MGKPRKEIGGLCGSAAGGGKYQTSLELMTIRFLEKDNDWNVVFSLEPASCLYKNSYFKARCG